VRDYILEQMRSLDHTDPELACAACVMRAFMDSKTLDPATCLSLFHDTLVRSGEGILVDVNLLQDIVKESPRRLKNGMWDQKEKSAPVVARGRDAKVKLGKALKACFPAFPEDGLTHTVDNITVVLEPDAITFSQNSEDTPPNNLVEVMNTWSRLYWALHLTLEELKHITERDNFMHAVGKNNPTV